MPRRTPVVPGGRDHLNRTIHPIDMKINVQSVHFDADVKLEAFIQEKVEKLTLFHDGIRSAEVILRLERDGENHENKVVEIKLMVPGSEHFAKRQSKTFEEGTINAVEALRSQIERSKEKLRNAS